TSNSVLVSNRQVINLGCNDLFHKEEINQSRVKGIFQSNQTAVNEIDNVPKWSVDKRAVEKSCVRREIGKLE
ncbi:hypothetical protein ACQUWZ_26780, partial [Ralstonia pseudosolanacearum]|uniref:hypothetical protein n=1 Tax=Ralstonia pseudosolanacearum TaxID=1310165 RepID=UPI003D182F11